MRALADAVVAGNSVRAEAWLADCALDRPTIIDWRADAADERFSSASTADLEAVVAGEIFDLDALAARWSVPPLTASNRAAVVLEGFRQDGDAFLDRLVGRFALVLADRRARRLLAVRDRIGFHPLYYVALPNDRLLFSDSIPTLLAHPGVSRAIDPVVVAEQLAHRFIDINETHYAQVRRVPPGHVLTVEAGRRSSDRYWDPGKSTQWLTEDDLGLFDPAFEKAVARCLPRGRTGIFLSGGFDSVSVAAVAADLLKRQGRPGLHALSLGFPEPDDPEPFIQRGVAQALGLSQDFVEYEDAVAHRGIFQPTLELGASWPLPIINLWAPAYHYLARLGAAQGCTAILTGTGGDEWLNISPYLAADVLQAGQIGEFVRLFGIFKRSFELTTWVTARNLGWRYGLRPLGSAVLDAVAPSWYQHRRHRNAIRNTLPWVAPDPAIRKAMDERVARLIRDARPPFGFYEQHMRVALEYPMVAMEYEEHFETGRRVGLQMLHPYLDSELVELLYRTPPALLTRGGRTKAMVRQAVARRFPSLGFGHQKKTDATGFFQKVNRVEGGAIWKKSGALTALGKLGVIDMSRAAAELDELAAGQRPNQSYRIWNILNLEGWVAAHL